MIFRTTQLGTPQQLFRAPQKLGAPQNTEYGFRWGVPTNTRRLIFEVFRAGTRVFLKLFPRLSG